MSQQTYPAPSTSTLTSTTMEQGATVGLVQDAGTRARLDEVIDLLQQILDTLSGPERNNG